MSSAGGESATPFGLAAARIVGTRLSRKTRTLLERGDSPRTGQPVWRNSYTEGTIEHRIWKPIQNGLVRGGKRWTGALLKAARKLEYQTRRERRKVTPGSHNGAIGEVGIEVLEFLYEIVDYASGRLEPAIATIAQRIGRSYSAVHEALCRLRKEGFIHWMRRSRPVDDPQPGGQQVEQIPNAYALLVPDAMKDWLGALFSRPPAATCEEDRRRREQAAFERMLAGMSAAERHRSIWNGDSLLGETLARLAAAVDAREKKKGESGKAGETGGVILTPT